MVKSSRTAAIPGATAWSSARTSTTPGWTNQLGHTRKQRGYDEADQQPLRFRRRVLRRLLRHCRWPDNYFHAFWTDADNQQAVDWFHGFEFAPGTITNQQDVVTSADNF
jgi:hypothetical protein